MAGEATAATISDEELRRLAGGGGDAAPADPAVPAAEGETVSDEELMRLAGGEGGPVNPTAPPAAAAQPPGDASAGEVGKEYAMAAGRGPVHTAEFAGDVMDINPLSSVAAILPQALASLSRGEKPDPMGVLRDSPHWKAFKESRGFFNTIGEVIMAPFKREGAGDRLRAKAVDPALEKLERERTDLGPVHEAGITATEFGSGALIPFGGPAAAAGKGALKVLKETARMAGLTGGGAGGGKLVAETADLGPTGTAVMEVFGSIVGATKGKVVTALPRLAKSGWALVKEISSDIAENYKGQFSEKTAETAVRAMLEGAEDPEAVLRNIKLAMDEGDVGTLAQIAEDAGVRGMEDTLQSVLPGFRQQVTQSKRKIGEQAVERLGAEAPGGVPEQASALPQARTARLTEQAKRLETQQVARSETQAAEATGVEGARLAKAVEAQTAATKKLEGRPDVPTSGAAVSESIETAEKAAKKIESAAWDKVPTEGRIPGKAVKEKLEAAVESFGPQVVDEFRELHSAVFRRIAAVSDEGVTGVDLNVLRGQLAQAINDAGRLTGKASRADSILAKLTDTLKTEIANSPGGEKFAPARKASLDRFETFHEGPLGKARKAAAAGKSAEVLGEKLTPSGTQGAATSRAALAAGKFSEDVAPAMADSLRAQFTRASGAEAGEFSARKAQTWLNNKAEALKGFPKLKTELDDIVTANTTAETVGKDVGAAQKTIEQTQTAQAKALRAKSTARQKVIEKSPSGKFAGESGWEQADKVLTSTTRQADMRQLVKNAKQKGAPKDQLKHLRAATAEALIRRLSSDAGKIKEGAERPFDLYRKTLAEVFEPEQVQRMERAVKLTRRMYKGDDVIAVTTPEFKAPKTIMAIARVLGAKLGGITTGQPLLVSNMSTELVKQHMKKLPESQFNRALIEMSMDPERFAKMARSLGEKELPPEEVLKILKNTFGPLRSPGPAVSVMAQEK